ncbi:putative RTA1 domain protein [Aureobasidium sp. EXF-8845]|nr:putative RTA1 domain protein [Aureobasidium sp. EXF-8845]KAI4842912.1 putative RTA1 domain protein [Aureobasidium sp. EXF-8846]
MSLFGAIVAIVEALNGLGVAFTSNLSSTQSIQELGSKLTKASLAVQLAVIVVCVVLTCLFFCNCAKRSIRSRKIEVPLVVLCSSMFLIFIRCIYRLIEHMGNWFFYVFEFTTILVNYAIWNIRHPGRYLPRLRNMYLSPDGSEVAAEEESDTRPLLAQGASILTFGVFFRKQKTRRGSSIALASCNSQTYRT